HCDKSLLRANVFDSNLPKLARYRMNAVVNNVDVPSLIFGSSFHRTSRTNCRWLNSINPRRGNAGVGRRVSDERPSK
nr:hypothetical protein [Tanacetum cinerariifolium]